ncbi:SIGLEC family-like protein 1 [Ochotona curzoniae]|uniref:SIGLEC family-like protein 1 n=1 Tax=Ochotona curzoniae TaxID=130825 RepID=UPI001B34CDF6|nr:SIGLEC family-like protein 1 [Ochotona curzoniae]
MQSQRLACFGVFAAPAYVLLRPAPARLLNSSCSWEKKTLQCSCSFRGVPTPSVQWWLLGGTPVSASNTNASLNVTSIVLEPWANSTVRLSEKPAAGSSLLCEGRNHNGVHALSILLMSGRSPWAPQLFLKGLLKGVVYGTLAVALLFLCLLPIIVKYIRVTQAQTTTAIKPKEQARARASQGRKKSLKRKETGESITAPSSESQMLCERTEERPYTGLESRRLAGV